MEAMTAPDKDREALERLENALIEDILAASDDDILAEAKEDGAEECYRRHVEAQDRWWTKIERPIVRSVVALSCDGGRARGFCRGSSQAFLDDLDHLDRAGDRIAEVLARRLSVAGRK